MTVRRDEAVPPHGRTVLSGVPLTPAQDALWKTLRIDPDAGAMTNPVALRIRGGVDLPALGRALDALVARHESLRTRVVEVGGSPTQEVVPSETVPVDVIDARGADEERVGLLVAGLCETPMSAEHAPVLRAHLVLADGADILVLVVHHLACDALSARILWRDVVELYHAQRTGRAPSLPDLPVQFADYASWEAARLDDGVRTGCLEHWRSVLATADLSDGVPPGHRDPGSAVDVVGTAQRVLDPGLVARVSEAAPAAAMSPNEVWYAGTLLAMLRGRDRSGLTVAVPVATRSRPEVRHVVGCFLRLVPLAVRADKDAPVSAWLAEVARSLRDAVAHADVPLAEIQAVWASPDAGLAPRLGDGPSTGRPCNVMVSVQTDVDAAVAHGVEPVPVVPTRLGHDLVIDLEAGRDGGTLAVSAPETVVAADALGDLADRVEASVRALVDLMERGAAATATCLGEIVAGSSPSRVDGIGQSTTGVSARGPGHRRLEFAILDTFSSQLGCHASVDDDYFALGGTSLSAMDLVERLGVVLRERVEVRQLLRAPTPRLLALALRGSSDALGRRDPITLAARDQVLPESIRPRRPRTTSSGCVVVTGGTGFLGAHLVASLLERGVPRVLCLVRADSDDRARERVMQALTYYELAATVDPERIHALGADLTLDRLGMSAARFEGIAEAADVIYHCGATMNFSLPYAALAAANVAGTREIVRLACTGPASELHFVSTTDARVTPVVPEAPVSIVRGSREGYVLSKKAAEHLVLQARDRGLEAFVYRPWQVTSSLRTGALGPRDQIALCLRAILATGLAPERSPVEMRVLPVDLVTDRLAELRGRPADGPAVVHLFNEEVRDFDDICEEIVACGHRLQRAPFASWKVEVARRTAGRIDGLTALLADDSRDQPPPGRVECRALSTVLGRTAGWSADDTWVPRTIAWLQHIEHSGPAPQSPPAAAASTARPLQEIP